MANSASYTEVLVSMAVGERRIRHQRKYIAEKKLSGVARSARDSFGRPYHPQTRIDAYELPTGLRWAAAAAAALAKPVRAAIALGEYDARHSR